MRISDWSSDVCSSDLIFDGGINRAKYQEMVRRASESRFRLHETERNAEADTRRAWNARETQTAVFRDLVDQSKSTDELRSEEHTSELQSLMRNSYAVFCLKKKNNNKHNNNTHTS